VYLNSVIRGHWGLSDPAHITGSEEEIAAAFQATFNALKQRVEKLLALPFEDLTTAELSAALNKIGKETM
jgi:arsenate reductase